MIVGLPSIRRSTSASQRVSGAVLVAFNDDFLLGYPPATEIGFWSEIARAFVVISTKLGRSLISSRLVCLCLAG